MNTTTTAIEIETAIRQALAEAGIRVQVWGNNDYRGLPTDRFDVWADGWDSAEMLSRRGAAIRALRAAGIGSPDSGYKLVEARRRGKFNVWYLRDGGFSNEKRCGFRVVPR